MPRLLLPCALAGWVVGSTFLSCGVSRPSPPAYATPELRARGVTLFEELRCAACHASPEARRLAAPDLSAVGARLLPARIEALLSNRIADVRHPDLFAGFDSDERAEAVHDVVQHLAARGGPVHPDGAGPSEVDAATIERGRHLYNSIGCVACHGPFEDSDTLEIPLWEFEDGPLAGADPSTGPFQGLRRRTTLAALNAYLLDPLAAHPDGRMPDMVLSGEEARALAAYLWFELSVETGIELVEGTGLAFEAYEETFDMERPDFAAYVPVRRGSVPDLGELPPHRDDHFGFRFQGFVSVPEPGLYTFATSTDDGSALSVDGELVLDNLGHHADTREEASVWLEPGRHSLELTYFEHEGGEAFAVTWSGPGFDEGPIASEALSHWKVRFLPADVRPFFPDPRRARRGGHLFDRLGCASCHDPGDAERRAPTAARISRDVDGGCLSLQPERGLPRYELSLGERRALVSALLDERPLASRPPADRLAADLLRLDCVACHRRDGLGAPGAERLAYFTVDTHAELGDEGRIPPQLTGVGAKLTPDGLRATLVEGEGVRPYMNTRMPRFGEENVAHLVELFGEVDDEPEVDAPGFDPDALEAGHRLVGTGGLGCIQCHDLAGHASLGVPAVDLATVAGRVRFPWFRELLMDPGGINMNTRMPSFWVDGKSPVTDVFDGRPEPQVEAIWQYLSLGDAMPLPEGLDVDDDTYELTPVDRPLMASVFWEGASPRTVVLGYPERINLAFDVEHSRLLCVWRGRFFNARGTWHGRAGGLERPPTEDPFDLPGGPPFAPLRTRDTPWPTVAGRAAGYRVLGRSLDAEGRPTFRYAFAGLEIAERVVPATTSRGVGFRRQLVLTGSAPPGDLHFRAATGPDVAAAGDGAWRVARGAELRFLDAVGRPIVRGEGAGRDLLLPVVFTPSGDGGAHEARIEVEVIW